MLRRDVLGAAIPAGLAGGVLLRGRGGTPPAPAGYQPPGQPGIAAGPSAGLVRARTLIVSGAGGGEFIYDAAGNLRSANVGATTTDPVQHITCQQGFSTFNGFGAVISLLSTAVAGYFQYLDTGSSSQGALAYSAAARAVTEPVTSQAVPQGVQLWNGALNFLTPVAHAGLIGVSGAGVTTGYMIFHNALGYQFDAEILASGGIASANPGTGGLESWHSLGTLAGYSVTRGQYRLSPQNSELELDISVTGLGANAATVNFSTTLAAPYQPLASYTQPLATNLNVASWTAGQPRVGVTAGGTVTLAFQANHTAAVVGTCCIPTS